MTQNETLVVCRSGASYFSLFSKLHPLLSLRSSSFFPPPPSQTVIHLSTPTYYYPFIPLNVRQWTHISACDREYNSDGQ